MAAKPIIDLMATAPDLGMVDRDSLKSLGYRRHFNGMADRLLYVRGARTHILHVVTLESWPNRNQRILRDHLRTHPRDADRDAQLKRTLAAAGMTARDYTRAKTELIQELTASA
nr:GrpB family protein [Fodinicola acaciae]